MKRQPWPTHATQEFLMVVKNTDFIWQSMIDGDNAFDLYRGSPDVFDHINPNELDFSVINREFRRMRRDNEE